MRIAVRALFLVCFLSVYLSGIANAQDGPDEANESRPIEGRVTEEVVVIGELSHYGATKSITPILETSRSISVITESTFRDRGALTLDDSLNYSAGVVGDVFGFSTRGDFPKVRGFDAAEYRDGQQVLFGFYNNTRSDIYMLEQVEVLKGPASMLYGKGTPGGIVNAISKLAGPQLRNEIVFDVGSNDRYQIAGDGNLMLTDELFFRVVGVNRESGTQVDNVDDNALIIMPSVTYQTASSSVTAMLEYVDRESDTAHQFLPLNASGCISDDVSVSPDFLCASAGSSEIDASTYLGEPGFNRYNTESTLLSVLGNHAFSEAFSIEGVARYKDGEADYRQSYVDFGLVPRIDAEGNGTRTFFASEASSEQLAVDVRLRWAFDTGIFSHELFGGIAYQDVTTDRILLFRAGQGVLNVYEPAYGGVPVDFTDGTPFSIDPQDSEDRGIYTNNQISVGAFRINLGVRYDETETVLAETPERDEESYDDEETSLSAGLLYAFSSGLSPYVSYGESFEPVIGTDGLMGPALKPREGELFEIGVKYQPTNTSTYITLAYFDIEESNLPNPSSLMNQSNSQQEGVGTVEGIEVEAKTSLGDWYLEGNVTVLDTESADGPAFDSVPEEQVSTWVQYTPPWLDGLRIGAGLRYVGENESNNSVIIDENTRLALRVVTDDVLLGDLLLGYTWRDWDLSLNIRNLSDEKYYGTCLTRGDCFPGEERSIVGRAVWQF